MRDQPIGLLDSSSGGLSIAAALRALLPHESILYIGDHANAPYSTKTNQFIRKRTKAMISFLISRGVKLVVVACNTSTVAGIDEYRKTFPDMPIVGVVPVIKTAATVSKKRNFIVLSTYFTAKSDYQKQLIARFAQDCVVKSIGSRILIHLIEQAKVEGPIVVKELRRMLTKKRLAAADVLVLGCTHYPFLRKALGAMIQKDMQVLDSGGAVARQVQRILAHNHSQRPRNTPRDEWFTTGDPGQVTAVARLLLKKPITFTYAAL